MSTVPQVAHMDETFVGVFGSPLKSQHCHFRDQSDPGILPGVQEMEPLMKLPEEGNEPQKLAGGSLVSLGK